MNNTFCNRKIKEESIHGDGNDLELKKIYQGKNRKEGHNSNQNRIKEEDFDQRMESSPFIHNNISTNQRSVSTTNNAKKNSLCSESLTSKKIVWIIVSLAICLIIILVSLSLTIWNKSENLPTKNENQVTSLDSLHKIYDENKDNIATTSETSTTNRLSRTELSSYHVDKNHEKKSTTTTLEASTINQGSWTELSSYHVDKNSETKFPETTSETSTINQASWRELESYIVNKHFGTKFTAFYAGYKIDCKGNPKLKHLYKWRYDCRCVDVLTQVSIKCRNHKSQKGACKGALVSLLQEMIEEQVYPVPVDASSMQYSC